MARLRHDGSQLQRIQTIHVSQLPKPVEGGGQYIDKLREAPNAVVGLVSCNHRSVGDGSPGMRATREASTNRRIVGTLRPSR